MWWNNAFHDCPSNFIDVLVKHFIVNFYYGICSIKPAEVFQNISFHKTGIQPPLLKNTGGQNILNFENLYHIEIACFQSVLILGPSLILVNACYRKRQLFSELSKLLLFSNTRGIASWASLLHHTNTQPIFFP